MELVTYCEPIQKVMVTDVFQPPVTQVKMFGMRNVQIIVLAPNENLKKKLAHTLILREEFL
jgi:hypothetical protein